ncbi:transposase [Vibrio sp. SS-MA-C1-2]|uniref:IS701 family transposase n=1 Tax=Vibrio sp. SS-MA-C1-2 TaxID=2908646 RepID=UPI001F3EC621|nr:transposase [Vibrio sp. SS-MA-C1-2]UJF17067.1 transposase [Vibrio sp. SS-MA-C1-2]
MNKNKQIFELYIDYLVTSFSYTTATGLSNLLDGDISHDQVTRFLSHKQFSSADLWQNVKKDVRDIEADDGVLIFDDTVQAKPYSSENDLINWHFDHTVGRSVKGINLLNCIYHANDVSIPVAFKLITKPIQYSDISTRKIKRKSETTKNDDLITLLKACQQNQLKWRYVLADSWFSSIGNMKFINDKIKKYFLLALKSNRLIALSKEDKLEGRFQRIDSLDWSDSPILGWVKGMDIPIILHRQIFKNKDGSEGILYLISNDIELDKESMEAIYQKRWKVEVFHKNIKSNTGLAKSPAKKERTQSNHIFMSLLATNGMDTSSPYNLLN